MADLALAAAGLVLSPFLQVFFERMATSEFDEFFRGRKLSDSLLTKLKIALLPVNAVLEDAENKQFTKPEVKEWLDMLKDAVYDAEDILEEIATKDLVKKLDVEFGAIACKVCSPISTSRFVKNVERKIDELLERLDLLVKQKENIGLTEGVGGKPLERPLTTSFIEESRIYGRDKEKKAIINSLLSDDASGVIAIVGMGGIGKTILAQLVYNDDRLDMHFHLKAWVCVSGDFDVFKVTKTILSIVTEETYDIKDLDPLQRKLEEKLRGKKFLLVLDDVWNEKCADWELLSSPFKSGARGSKVIVTTRNEEVASIMFASAIHHIKELPKEDCWSLFAKYAFHDGNSDAYLELEVVGKQIVEKCKGLPLAIKAIGALLRSKLDVKEWDMVLRSELWDLSIKTDILPALGLSYNYLPPHLKRCFAYCSIFPKDYAFKKDTLVLLWMAEGFLPEYQNKTMEEVGHSYFIDLVSRSFFQQSSGNKYIMHDLVNDLAKFISKQFVLSLTDESSCVIGSKSRHLSHFPQSVHIKNFEVLRLRTIVELHFFKDGLFYESETQFLLPMIRCLRVLILSRYRDFTTLPDSIGEFIHLRYLDFSNTGIKRLPDSICKLCNLQILNLSNCRDLAGLPKDMHKLINLRHLDFADTKILEMPASMGKLKYLQTITRFIVGKHSGSSIEEVGKLTNLRGSLPIFELQNVESPMNAKDGSLRDLKHIKELVLEWRVETNASKIQISVLDSLQPHTNLKNLVIRYYGGKIFPDWVGHASFSNIASLRLEYCKFCCSLPPLGQLPSLQELSIGGLDGVVTVGREFYGSGSYSIKPFGALKVLRIFDMLGWEEWLSFDTKNGGEAFSKLEELEIRECPKLTRGLPVHLPSLAKLEIRKCPKLVFSLPRASSQCKMILKSCNTMILSNESPTGIQKLEIREFDALELTFQSCQCKLMLYNCNTVVLLNDSPTGIQELEIRQLDALELTFQSCRKLELPMHLDYSSLEYLKLDVCDSLKSFPLDSFPKLRRLQIIDCVNLESLTVRQQHEHDLLLSHIEIRGCTKFAYFPKGELRAPNLKEFWVTNCESLPSLPDKMHILLSSLEKLYIKYCPQIESFPEGGLPSNLGEITILDCEKLYARRIGWDLQNLPSVRIFSIGDESEDVESFPDEGLLPTNLTYLHIEGFPNLKSLDKKGLQHLTALGELKIRNCPKLKCMPEDGLPASLSTLRISYCHLLKKELERKEGPEWRKIAHVPNIMYY